MAVPIEMGASLQVMGDEKGFAGDCGKCGQFGGRFDAGAGAAAVKMKTGQAIENNQANVVTAAGVRE